MIQMKDKLNNVLEIKCDICGVVFDDKAEIKEFMCFDYQMGEKSLYPNADVKFDVCQDCFTGAFPEIFEQGDIEDEIDNEDVFKNK